MATYTQLLTASLGSSLTGKGTNVGYKVIDSAGTTQIARTTASITEESDAAGNATTGIYRASPTFNTSWAFPVRVIWTVTGQTGVVAEEVLYSIVSGTGTYAHPIVVSFGSSLTGKGSNVGYSVIDAAGTTQIARTTTGISEETDAAGNAVTGTYYAIPNFSTSWIYPVRVLWNITSSTGVAAEEVLTSVSIAPGNPLRSTSGARNSATGRTLVVG